MKEKTKKRIMDGIAIVTMGLIAAIVLLGAGFIMRLGVVLESDMPSMQNEGLDYSEDCFDEVKFDIDKDCDI